jgi:hypothetical protein
MGVVVEDIRIINEFTTNETNYLLGNIGDKVTIEVDFRAEEVFVTGAEVDVDRLLLAPQPFRVNVADTTDIIYCENANAFVNYKVGDTYVLNIGGVNQTERYIYEKLSNQAFRVHTVGGTPGDTDFYATNGNVYDTSLSANDYIFLSTDLTAINYRWNFIENISGDYYRDKIASQLNQAKAAGVDNNDTVTVVPMVFDAPVTNNYGTISVKGNGSSATSQKFTLTHETIITPFFLAGQESDLENGVSPGYLNAASSLKYVTSIDVGRNSNDPNFIETVDFSALDGNVGGYNENFNGNNNDYSVGSVVYKRLDTTVIDSIELTDDAQTVEIGVVSNNGTFSDNNTEFSLNFCILPDDPDDYRNNNKTIVQNFYFDRGANTVGSAGVPGDNNGTDEQIFSNIEATFVDANNITITGTIDLTTLGITDLSSKGFNYFIWVSVADYTKQTEESDRVSLIADIEPFFVDVSDDNLIAFDTKFLRHYESDTATEGTTNLIARTEDDVLGYTQFTIDRLGRETDTILLSSAEIELIAKKSDGSEFVLESFNQSFNGSLVVNDSQYIDNTIDRVFKMPNNEQRKQIKVNRRIDLDTTELRYYEIAYPFLFRWEYWIALANVNSDAFDTSEPNNGFNEQWHRYDTLTDWDIYYRTKINLTKNGTALTYQEDSLMETFTYEEGTDWINEDITGVDATTLTSTGTLLTGTVKLTASKEYNGPSVPASADDVEWVMRIEIYENGGISDIRFFSSVYDWSENSWFSSVDASNKIIKNKSGNIFTAECLLDSSVLPESNQFKISARIYDESALAPIPPNTKLAEDGNPKGKEDDDFKIKD